MQFNLWNGVEKIGKPTRNMSIMSLMFGFLADISNNKYNASGYQYIGISRQLQARRNYESVCNVARIFSNSKPIDYN